MYVAEFIEDEVKENILELLFEDQKATLSCTFDENNTCNASHIFLDDLDELSNYISYLNKTYTYDYIKNRWVLPNSFISIIKTKDDIYFVSFCWKWVFFTVIQARFLRILPVYVYHHKIKSVTPLI